MAGPQGLGMFSIFNKGFTTTYTNMSANQPLTMESMERAYHQLKRNSDMDYETYSVTQIQRILGVDDIHIDYTTRLVLIRCNGIQVARTTEWFAEIKYIIDKNMIEVLSSRKSDLHREIEKIYRDEQRRIHEKHARVCVPGQIVRASDGGWDIQACSGSGGVNMAQTEPPKKQEVKVEDPVQDLIAYYYAQNI